MSSEVDHRSAPVSAWYPKDRRHPFGRFCGEVLDLQGHPRVLELLRSDGEVRRVGGGESECGELSHGPEGVPPDSGR